MLDTTHLASTRGSLKQRLFKTIVVATMTLSLSHAHAGWVYDPANFIQNLVSALEALKETSDRAVQMRTQYQQYRAEVAQLANMPAKEKARLKEAANGQVRDVEGFISAVNKTYGSVNDVTKRMSKRFDEQKLSGLSWDDYMKAEGNLVKRGVQAAQQRQEIDRKALTRVQEDYAQVKEWQGKIGSTQGTHESMQLMNAQLNKVITQNAELMKLMALNSMRENENKVDEMAKREKQKTDAQSQLDAVNKANKQSDDDLARWKKKS